MATASAAATAAVNATSPTSLNFLRNFVSGRLYSGNSYQIYFGLTCLLGAEFFNVLVGPVLSRIVVIILSLILPRTKRFDFNKRRRMRTQYGDDSDPLDFDPPEVEQYKSFLDDKKAKIANEGDIYLLLAHGYHKHRFVSNQFLDRNKLRKSTQLNYNKK